MRTSNRRRVGIVTILSLFTFLSLSAGTAWAGGKWYTQFYTGQSTLVPFYQTPFKRWDLQNEYLVSLAVGKELRRLRDHLTLEAEGQVVGHWGDSGGYMECVGSVILRWHRFPWERHVRTTFGFGEGLSFANRIPDHEIEKPGDPGSRLLNYLMYEVTLAHPEWEHTHFFFRVHHRSGIFGLFNGVHGASNYPSLGIKYVF